MKQYVEGLRNLCAEPQRIAPFLLRTRFERNLYGLIVAYCESVFGEAPAGPTAHHVADFLEGQGLCVKQEHARVLHHMATLFEKFTYLCDTSTWSDDGQDPRVRRYRREILEFCDMVESPVKE